MKVYDVSGKEVGDIELPMHFNERVREDLIRRAVIAAQANRIQPKGTDIMAGLKTSARYVGRRRAYRQMINRSISRLPRIFMGGGRVGNVRKVPQAVKGRRAHPPKVEKVLIKKMNVKERRKAIRSAIAATANIEYVKRRNHIYEGELPIIVEGIEKLEKVKDVLNMFKALNVIKDIERVRERIKRRSGVSRRRGRAKKEPKSILIVGHNTEKIHKAARNIPGVDVIDVRNLNAEVLAPGTHPGRLTVWSKDAVKMLEGLFI